MEIRRIVVRIADVGAVARTDGGAAWARASWCARRGLELIDDVEQIPMVG